MILKKFFGKTIEVARKSARQMYGDDIVVLESFHPDGDREAGVTVLVDTPSKGEKKGAPKEKDSGEKTPFRNVFYKRRDAATKPVNGRDVQSPGQNPGPGPGLIPGARQEYQPVDSQLESPGQAKLRPSYTTAETKQREQVSPNLMALREYAAREERGNSERLTRSNGRANGRAESNGSARFAPDVPEPTVSKRTASSTPFEPTAPVYGPPSPSHAAGVAAGQQREITALHKRFDKLESLLDSALISSNLDYASHPAFQQLVRTGIRTTVIARWFREIMESGIDPDEEPEQFMAALGDIIRKALKGPADRPMARHLLFAGPSGSGKTSLIMKLVQHPEFLAGKKVGVATMLPDEKTGPYYTILEPFCRERNIPYFGLRASDGVQVELDEWKSFDHVLIDTPSIPVTQERGFREYWKIRQTLAAANPLEVHYVINASLNRYYFRESGSMHHPLQPDFIAITHLDEATQWGPAIPFMAEMGCGSRFISIGADIPAGLREFSPAWFAQQVLQDT